MESFWKWLIRANARGVFLVSLVVFAVVIAWWVWREFAPLEQSVMSLPGVTSERTRESLGIQAFLEEQRSSMDTNFPPSPFLSIPFQPVGKPAPTSAPPPDATAPSNTVAKPSPRPDALRPGTQKKRETVSLVFRGLFKRTDGRTVALIEDSKTQRSRFYAPGDRLHGVEVTEISAGEVGMKLSDGTLMSMEFGKSETFEDGKRAR